MNPKRFEMLQDSTLEPKANAGAVVYDCMRCDYGIASDDTRLLGYPHRSVTLDPEGGYPFFSVPERHLRPLPAAPKQEGWQLVPVEPTDEMFGAGGVQQFRCDLAGTQVRKAVGLVYAAMLAAAPKQET